MLTKIIIIMGIIMSTMAGGFYWYYSNSQETIAGLHKEKALLETAHTLSQETIRQMKLHQIKVAKELTQINVKFAETREQNTILAKKLEKHDIGVLAAAKPGLVGKIINNASANASRCIELLSGATLTDKEKTATSAKSFNSECPWLWNGDK